MTRREFVAGLAALGLTRTGLVALKGLRRKPRAVVVFYADDLGYGDTSTYGQSRVPTPNLDRLAAEGCRFTDAHAPTAVCTPSRYSLLTGDYAFRRPGTTILDGDAKLILPELVSGRLTLPALMKAAGYRTAAIGKWHLGLGAGDAPIDWNRPIAPGPRECGFDESFILAATADRVPCVFLRDGIVENLDPADPIEIAYTPNAQEWPDEVTARNHPELLKAWGRSADRQHDKTIVDGISRIGHMRGGQAARWRDEEISDTLAREAERFLAANEGSPVFLYFCTSDVHVPRDPHPRFRGRTDLGIRGDTTVQMDACLGAVRHSVAAHGYADTLFVFTSDNGPYIADGYQDGASEAWKGVNPAAPYRGGKYGPYEGGTRVPFVVSWPGVVRPGTTSAALVSQTDLARTLAGLLGVPVPAGSMRDAEDVGAALFEGGDSSRKTLVEQPGWGPWGYREGNWKLVASDPPQLFDLSADPGETTDCAAAHPDLVRRLQENLKRLTVQGSNGRLVR